MAACECSSISIGLGQPFSTASRRREQRADARVAAPGKHQPGDAAHADELVVDQVRGHADQGEAPLALADDLMAGRMGDEVGEPLHGHAVAVPDGLGHRLGERQKARHGPSRISAASLAIVIYGACPLRSNGGPARCFRDAEQHAHGAHRMGGDCDPAGIVFYPRYFAMFDHSTTLLIERTLGMSKHQLQEAHGFAGYPMVESRARFLLPTRFGDDVEIETSIAAVRCSSSISPTV